MSGLQNFGIIGITEKQLLRNWEPILDISCGDHVIFSSHIHWAQLWKTPHMTDIKKIKNINSVIEFIDFGLNSDKIYTFWFMLSKHDLSKAIHKNMFVFRHLTLLFQVRSVGKKFILLILASIYISLDIIHTKPVSRVEIFLAQLVWFNILHKPRDGRNGKQAW